MFAAIAGIGLSLAILWQGITAISWQERRNKYIFSFGDGSIRIFWIGREWNHRRRQRDHPALALSERPRLVDLPGTDFAAIHCCAGCCFAS